MSVIGIAMDRWRPASASATGDQRSWRLARGWIWTHFSHGRMREAWSESAERGRRERRQHLTGAGGRTRADTKRPSCPSGELDQGQNLRLAVRTAISTGSADRAGSVPRLERSRGRADLIPYFTARCGRALVPAESDRGEQTSSSVRSRVGTNPPAFLGGKCWQSLKPSPVVRRPRQCAHGPQDSVG